MYSNLWLQIFLCLSIICCTVQFRAAKVAAGGHLSVLIRKGTDLFVFISLP